MKVFLVVFCVIVCTQAYAQQSDAEKTKGEVRLSDPASLAYTSSANLASVSAMLQKSQDEVKAMIATRTNSILEREGAVAVAENSVNSIISIYKNTRSSELAVSLQSLIAAGDRAAAEPATLAASQAALFASIKETTALPELSTEKIDSAAKKLASLAKEYSRGARAQEWVTFIQDTKNEVKKLDDAANKAATTAVKQSSEQAEEETKKLKDTSAKQS